MKRPTIEHRYNLPIMDSARWDGFEPREDDILVCTSYKAGTTWTQMICALLLFQKPKLEKPISDYSPWLDRRGVPIEDIFARYEAQTHRRFIKSHSPLDAMPFFESATYLYVGRDPRDTLLSMLNHMRNTRPEAMERIASDPDAPAGPPPGELPEDPDEIFRAWLTRSAIPWEKDGFPFFSHFRHAQTFWNFRALPNIHFLHYEDLLRDLDGEMRRVAEILGVPIDEAIWPQLVEAATFDSMRENADRVAPEAANNFWKRNEDFFRTGKSGQWRGVFSEESLALYDSVKIERVGEELARWLEVGTHASFDPKTR
jgi:aryl sulfotransferase